MACNSCTPAPRSGPPLAKWEQCGSPYRTYKALDIVKKELTAAGVDLKRLEFEGRLVELVEYRGEPFVTVGLPNTPEFDAAANLIARKYPYGNGIADTRVNVTVHRIGNRPPVAPEPRHQSDFQPCRTC